MQYRVESAPPIGPWTTKPVASEAKAASVSNEHVWQKRIETTLLTTSSMASCQSELPSAIAFGEPLLSLT
jgi:hypothetical protein